MNQGLVWNKMVYDNYVRRGFALWIVVGMITAVLLIEGGGAATIVDDGGVGIQREGEWV